MVGTSIAICCCTIWYCFFALVLVQRRERRARGRSDLGVVPEQAVLSVRRQIVARVDRAVVRIRGRHPTEERDVVVAALDDAADELSKNSVVGTFLTSPCAPTSCHSC